MELSLSGARALLLAAQGLQQPPSSPATKADVLAAIRRMSVLQIDSIHIIARSHLLVLWSRLGAFDPAWLDELLAEAAIFEGWSHAACFLPIEDFALYRPAMLDRYARSREDGWISQHEEVTERVLLHLREEGAVRAGQLQHRDGPAGVWWDWTHEKIALEELLRCGEVMIARRESFQRIYDLRERVLPGWSDAELPSPEEVEQRFVEKSVKALGLATAPSRWTADYFRRPMKDVAKNLKALAEEGVLTPVAVPELGKAPFYAHRDHQKLAEAAAAETLSSSVTTLLSPFDPIVWHRQRAQELFGFEYRIEVYTPAEKRKFGYFTLPILHRGELIGRLCPKAHRKEGLFEVRHLHLEPNVTVTDTLVAEVGAALKACAAWHGTPEVVIREAESPELGAGVQAAAA